MLGRPFLRPHADATVPPLPRDARWGDVVEADLPSRARRVGWSMLRRLTPAPLLRAWRRARVPVHHPADVVADGAFGMPIGAEARGTDDELAKHREPMKWHPAHHYREAWPEMRAFVLPSFNDGEIRVNVRGREGRGIVDPADFVAVCDELIAEIELVVDPHTGLPAADAITRTRTDPFDEHGPDGDIVVSWRGSCLAFEHPRAGLVGPYPMRRTGGHTDPYGFALVVGPRAESARLDARPSVDLAATVLSLLGRPADHLEGQTLV